MKALHILKHLFVPHEHNQYRPHIFRELTVASIVALSIFFLGLSVGSSLVIHRTVLGAQITASVLIDLTNESRLANNEQILVRNDTLDKAASLKAEDMVQNQYFAHTSPTGITPWHWFQEAGYNFLYAGENLAINFVDPTAVRDAWLASPKHRENLLDVRFKEIGMATLDGVYKAGPAIYVVQLFGTPTAAAQIKEIVTEPETSPASDAQPETTEKAPVSSPVQKSISPDTKTLAVSATGTPEIKGESTPQEKYQPVVNTESFAVVKNTEAGEPSSYISPKTAPVYSTWYERMLFGGSYYVQLMYKILLGIILIGLIAAATIEVRRQHWKHMVYGLSVMLVVSLCISINQAFF